MAYRLIGAGGFGKVFLIDEDTVVKAIYTSDACSEAYIEFKKQQKIYNTFERLGRIKTENPLVKKVQKLVKVARPISYSDSGSVINLSKFACTITMSRLRGLPLNLLRDGDRAIDARIKPDYLAKNGNNLELMGHIALNSEIGGIYGINYTVKQIGDNNPPRGYFITESSSVFGFLKMSHNIPSIGELNEIMGFIYGWILFSTNIIPIDIEIAFGLYDDEILINVLDFGMTFDLDDIENNKKLPRSSLIFDILERKDLDKDERYKLIIEAAVNDISIDLYSDVVDNKESRHGFRVAADFNSNLIK